MKLMVLQARHRDDPMLEHERACFIAASGLADASFEWRNVVDGVPGLNEVEAVDGLLIGGSGHFSVADQGQDFFPPLFELLRRVVESAIPTFGSCFGYQLLVVALGGRVAHEPTRGEVGSYEVELTDDGRRDPLFGRLPDRFVAQMGHLDCAVSPPAGSRNLVRSQRCPLQALKIDEVPIWATQFHPELDRAANLHRYRAYIERYGSHEDGSGGPGFSSLDSPEASRLLPLFIEFLRSGEAPGGEGG